MKKAIEVEWNRTDHIAVLWKDMEKARAQAERWGLVINEQDMVKHAYGQMDDSGIFDKKHLMDWERKENHEKTWGEMKTYFGDEYEALLKHEPSLGGTLESANQLMEGQTTQQQRGATRQQAQMEVTQFFEELRRDAIVGMEQIQQMSEAFTGAAGTMKEVMERLKEANAEIKTLTQVNANLTNQIKQLTENNKTLAAALKDLGGKRMDAGNTRTGGRGGASNLNGEKCNICKMVHQKPFQDHCWELERNASKRPENWVSRL
jgi:DNA repair exonuclease SbcCD ATPase subunit